MGVVRVRWSNIARDSEAPSLPDQPVKVRNSFVMQVKSFSGWWLPVVYHPLDGFFQTTNKSLSIICLKHPDPGRDCKNL